MNLQSSPKGHTDPVCTAGGDKGHPGRLRRAGAGGTAPRRPAVLDGAQARAGRRVQSAVRNVLLSLARRGFHADAAVDGREISP